MNVRTEKIQFRMFLGAPYLVISKPSAFHLQICNRPMKDRSLCSVRVLYYLAKTMETRKIKDLVFVSYKKSFNNDIFHATISSWNKLNSILNFH